MKPEHVLFFDSAAEFRGWLMENHEKAAFQWVGFYKKAARRTGLDYAEAVEEALCFGWIDGQGGPIDELSRAIRFTPRRNGSIWSSVNVARVYRLIAEGRMAPAGTRAFQARTSDRTGVYSHDAGHAQFPAELEAQFRANAVAWEFWNSTPPGYRRQMTWWVVSAKRHETRGRRFDALVQQHAARERLDPLHLPKVGQK